MIFKVEGHKLRSGVLAFALALTAGASFLPVEPVHAQTRTLPDFTGLVDQVGPSVVNIRTIEKVTPRAGNGEMDEEMQEFFRRFFGQPLPGAPRSGPRQNRPQQPQEEERPRGVGSGFILTADGYVMTNAHVVEDASEVLVTLPDKREFKAKIVGADKRTDVAVVKIEATGLPAVKVGDISRLRVGEWVMAIGSPFGLESTVTAGIVSAKKRETGDYLQLLQTDVAINPGNSGGPLFNLNGEVVGINSQIYSRSGGYMGLSFAIPIDVAMNIKDQLQKTGKVSHGKLGVTIQPVTKDLAESFGLTKAEGALISNVEAGSPAEKAGLRAGNDDIDFQAQRVTIGGDVLLAINGKPVDQSSDVPRAIGDMHAGDRASLKVWRKGATRDVTVALGEMNQETVAEAPEAAQEGGKLGLALRPLSPDERSQIKSDGGLVVEEASGPAAQAGIRQGDVLLAFNGEKISSVEQLRKLVGKAKGKVAVLVQRDEARIYVPINLG